MNKFKISTLLATIAIAASAISFVPAYADSGVYGSVSLASDNVFRGVTKSNENASLGGTLGLQLDSGLYIQGDVAQVELAGNDTEIDVTGGLRTDLVGLTLDVGAIRYAYKGGADIDSTEVFAKLSGQLSVFALQGSINHDVDTDVNYFNVRGSFTPFYDISLLASYGVTDTDGDNTNDWFVGASKAFGNFDLEGGYYANDADFKLAEISDNKVAIKATYNF